MTVDANTLNYIQLEAREISLSEFDTAVTAGSQYNRTEDSTERLELSGVSGVLALPHDDHTDSCFITLTLYRTVSVKPFQ